MPTITGINHIAITVPDVDKSAPWYSEVLGIGKLMEQTEPNGHGLVLLGKPDFSMLVGLHRHPTNDGERFSETRTGLDHVSFMVPSRSELDEWESHLTELGVEHSPVSDQTGYSVLVFRDPDNVQLEFISMG